MSDVLQASVFPAVVTLPDGGEWRSAKVFASSDELWVYVDGGGRPSLLAHTSFRRVLVGGDTTEYVLADGSTVTVRKGGGCGCGSPLRSMVAPEGVAPRYGT